MILVENRFQEIFETLPNVSDLESVSLKPKFDFGTHTDLLRFLEVNRNQRGIYPLVWLETPFIQKGDDKRPNMRLKFVLATLTNSSFTNLQRLDISFKSILVPLYENVITAMTMCGFIEFKNEKENKKACHYNYGPGEKEHHVPEVWDVIVFERDVEMTDCPTKTIYYQ